MAILKIILGLPSRAPTIAIHYLLGMLLLKCHLSFLYRILALPDSAVSRAVLLARCGSSHKGYPYQIGIMLQDVAPLII